MDFTVVARAGLTQVEFAQLVGVSRVTVNTWVKGRVAPNKFIKAKIASVLAYIEEAIVHQSLPLGSEVGPLDREDQIKAAVRGAIARATPKAG